MFSRPWVRSLSRTQILSLSHARVIVINSSFTSFHHLYSLINNNNGSDIHTYADNDNKNITNIKTNNDNNNNNNDNNNNRIFLNHHHS